MEGEDGESESEHAFGRARLRRRILIVAAGALMNFLIGFDHPAVRGAGADR